MPSPTMRMTLRGMGGSELCLLASSISEAKSSRSRASSIMSAHEVNISMGSRASDNSIRFIFR